MLISKKWRVKAENYKWFARGYPTADFSEDAAEKMYIFESTGCGYVNHYDVYDGMVNGYALGKHLQDIQIAMWVEDLKRPFMLTKYELLTDPELQPIRKLLNDVFGDVDDEIPSTKGYCDSLYKFIGEYMY